MDFKTRYWVQGVQRSILLAELKSIWSMEVLNAYRCTLVVWEQEQEQFLEGYLKCDEVKEDKKKMK